MCGEDTCAVTPAEGFCSFAIQKFHARLASGLSVNSTGDGCACSIGRFEDGPTRRLAFPLVSVV